MFATKFGADRSWRMPAALLLALALLFPLPSVALALATGTALEMPFTILGRDRSLGSVRLYDPNGALVTGTQIIITLPEGVEFSNDAAAFNINDIVDIPATYLGTTNNINGVAYVASASGSQSLVVEITAMGAGDMSALDFKFHGPTAVDISDPRDVYVSFMSNNYTVDTAPVLVAQCTARGTTAAVDGCPLVSSGDNQALASIEVSELSSGSISQGSSFDLKLPQGFIWASPPDISVSGDVRAASASNVKTDAAGLSYVTVTVSSASVATGKASIVISEIRANIAADAPDGDIVADLIGDGSHITSGTLVLGRKAATSAPVEDESPPAENELPLVDNAGSFTVGSRVYYLNEEAASMDVEPLASNGRLLLPCRYLAIVLGIPDDAGHIKWDPASRTVTLETLDNRTAIFTVDSGAWTLEGQARTMDAAPLASDNRLFLPARFLAEALGGSVSWDPLTQTAHILISY